MGNEPRIRTTVQQYCIHRQISDFSELNRGGLHINVRPLLPAASHTTAAVAYVDYACKAVHGKFTTAKWPILHDMEHLLRFRR